MRRLTTKISDGVYSVLDSDLSEVMRLLGVFEDAYEELIQHQTSIPSKLEELRLQGKEKTVTYKELMAQKLINNHVLTFFRQHGLT